MTQRWHQNSDQAKAAAVGASTENDTQVTLQSWKEIASALNRGVRTVQRWERELGLPVRRVGKGSRAPVFAFKDELHRWLANARNNETRDRSLMHSVDDFFRARESADLKQTCDQCGSPMEFLKGQFWMDGTKRQWNLSVPFCAVCDGDSLASFCSSHIVQ
jgi:hypothetical protein